MNSGAHSACLWKWFDLFEVKYVHGSWGFNKLSPSRLWPNLQAWGYHWVEKWGFFHPTLHFLGEIIQLCCFFWIHLVWHNMTIQMLASLRMMQWLKILWCWAYLLRETTWSLRGFISLGRRNICKKFMKVIITVVRALHIIYPCIYIWAQNSCQQWECRYFGEQERIWAYLCQAKHKGKKKVLMLYLAIHRMDHINCIILSRKNWDFHLVSPGSPKVKSNT